MELQNKRVQINLPGLDPGVQTVDKVPALPGFSIVYTVFLVQ